MLLLQFNPIFHFMFLGSLETFATLLTSVRAPSALKGIVQGFSGAFPCPKDCQSRKILPADMAPWRSAFCMGFPGDVGFPLLLKMLQNASLRECELLISTLNFFIPCSSHLPHLRYLLTSHLFIWNLPLPYLIQILCQIAQLDWLCSFMAFLKSTFPLVGI